jgi:hypothetical protein
VTSPTHPTKDFPALSDEAAAKLERRAKCEEHRAKQLIAKVDRAEKMPSPVWPRASQPTCGRRARDTMTA